MAIKSVLHTNQQSIDRVLGAGLPVALVFWTSKQPAADVSNELLESIATNYAGKALVARVNVGEEPDLAARFNVQHLPSFVFFTRQGKVEATLPGPLDKAYLKSWLDYLTSQGERPTMPVYGDGGGSRPGANGQQANGHQHEGQNGAAQSGPLHLTDRSFAQAVQTDKPVLVDFWAEWCGPCRIIGPSIDQLAKEFAGRAVVAKLNVDENQATARRYNVMSIPTLLVFKKGEVVERIVGVQPLPTLRQILAKHAGS